MVSSSARRAFATLVVWAIALTALPLPGSRDLVAQAPANAPASAATGEWRQWGGPNRNFIVPATGLADRWPDTGPPLLWSRPLGTGHSAIVVDDGRLFTMYRVGNGRARQGPWDAEEAVIALDATSGRTIWEHKYPSRREDFSYGAGPHSTPLIVRDRVFTIGTNQQLFAFDKRSGKVLWSHDFIKEFSSPELLIRPVVKTGYGCSLIAFRDTVICSVGGPGQSVMAFRQSDGAVVWKSGDFLTSAAAPILIELAGNPQVVFLAGGTVTGLDPATGSVLWSHPHDPGNDLNCLTPLWGPDNILFVSSAYKAGSRAIQLRQEGGATHAEELWFTNRVRFMFLSAIRVGDYVYGTTGDFGPAFLTALNVKTGQPAWQHRGFGRASLLYADGKAIIMDEDGDLALAKLAPEGVTVLAQTKIFDTMSWTVPTLAGTTLYARDREKIVSLDLGQGGPAGRAETAGRVAQAVSSAPASSDAPASISSIRPPAVFAGSWKLDMMTNPSTALGAGGVGIAGLIAAGAPPMIFITQPANGTLVIESPINEGHARLFVPGRKTTTPVGQGGTITMTSEWAGRTLISQGSTVSATGSSVAVKEVFSLSADGTMLTIDVTNVLVGRAGLGPAVTAGAASTPGRATTTEAGRLKYTRLRNVGPCETWPTPCKRAGGLE